MKIIISDDAKKHLSKKGKDIVMIEGVGAGGCVETSLPYVFYKKPENESEFIYQKVDEIDVYVSKYFHLKDDTLSIETQGKSIFKEIVVKGIKVI